MSELEYDKNRGTELQGAGITPPSNPINLRGVIKAMLANWPTGGGSGTVTSVSVASANGLAGTVATATTTPAITLSTSITGLLKGNGTAVSAAVAGTDFVAATTGSAIQKSNGSGGLTAAVSGTDYPATGVITGGGPTGSATVVPVITYNANGQLTAVTTAATVGSVAATDTSIVVGGTATAPTIATGTLDVIATQHAPAANWSNNSHRITSLGAPAAVTDAATALGTCLAQVFYEPSAGNSYTIASTTFAAIDTTNLTISFTPISTAVGVELTGDVAVLAAAAIGFCLFTHGSTTQVGYHVVVVDPNAALNTTTVTARIHVTGLTAGSATQLDWAWATTASTAVLSAKGVTSGVIAATDVGPAIMRVFAA